MPLFGHHPDTEERATMAKATQVETGPAAESIKSTVVTTDNPTEIKVTEHATATGTGTTESSHHGVMERMQEGVKHAAASIGSTISHGIHKTADMFASTEESMKHKAQDISTGARAKENEYAEKNIK